MLYFYFFLLYIVHAEYSPLTASVSCIFLFIHIITGIISIIYTNNAMFLANNAIFL